jgi:hypothetical protein
VARRRRRQENGLVTQLGRLDGPVLVVDLQERGIENWPELWAVLREELHLPSWFGDNLNAWWDTIQTGAISEYLDGHSLLVLQLRPAGFFATEGGQRFITTTDECEYAEVRLVD